MRASNQTHAPTFHSDNAGADDDDESGLLSGTRTRTRRQYDEWRDVDDMEGIEDEVSLEQLGDIKAKSIVE